jgi:hypothetical protein
VAVANEDARMLLRARRHPHRRNSIFAGFNLWLAETLVFLIVSAKFDYARPILHAEHILLHTIFMLARVS